LIYTEPFGFYAQGITLGNGAGGIASFQDLSEQDTHQGLDYAQTDLKVPNRKTSISTFTETTDTHFNRKGAYHE
jgi:hypothetical protein